MMEAAPCQNSTNCKKAGDRNVRTINDKAETEKRDYSEIGLDKQIERARDVAEADRAAPAILHSGKLGDGAYEQRARDSPRAIGSALETSG